ncbi:hypothetical protein PHSY_000809 [Pseudozyma hubeiensis SY62]|uniref:Vacuolar protein sorting-associated protein 27 n=1 Tax=Pseudozyma hubeiensis (strain SY62) TaxID=1305764 RepID=R9P561_PSEHS|nr:hypothetical protein PHSY_000809 [Pseudozyma hubeiensis SY62]GAC93245.1 hypothetical protein PHSY_000809 [Pseudozyma hubeiensis SY62]
MSALWSGWGADAFTEQVEKATSELLPVGSEDIALNLEICDQVRAKQVPAKQAMQVLKRRVSHKNPNVVLLALGLTDICIKNGGDHFLQEVASREFMDNLVSVLRNPSGVNNDVKNKALGLIQNWSQIAQAKPSHMSYITDIYKQLKSDDNLDFPPLDPNATAAAALVETLTAPEWVDGEVCMRCRTAFTTFNRKHHCRNCGNVFCQQCSSHNMALPWFGIGQDVRVCDGCFARKGPPKNAAKLSRSKSASSSSPSASSKHVPTGRGASSSSSHQRSATVGSKSKRNARQKEEDDIALAIKLSLEASGQGAAQASRPDTFATPSQPSAASSTAQKAPNGRVLEGTDADDDPDLAAAIAASLRDWAPPQPSAPLGLNDTAGVVPTSATYANESASSNLPLPPSLDLAPQDVDNILTFSQTVRAQQAHNQRSGMVGALLPPSVQTAYERASSSRPRMARNLEEGHRRHNVLVSMHDKLTEAVRLYDHLLDAQMTRPAQSYVPNGYAQADYRTSAHQGYGYGYEQSTPSHESAYAAQHTASSSLYPQAPQIHADPRADPQGTPAQWHPQQHQQLQYQQQTYRQDPQQYATQPSQPPFAPHQTHQQQHLQQHPDQQYHHFTAPQSANSYSNGVYSDPNQALSPAPAAASAQYAPYDYSSAPIGGASDPQANGAAWTVGVGYAEVNGAPSMPSAGPPGALGSGPLSVRTEGIMSGAPSNVSAVAPPEASEAIDDSQGDESRSSRLSADASLSSRNGWTKVPIQAVGALAQQPSPTSHVEPALQHQQPQPQQYQQHPPQQQRQQQAPVKADTSCLPLFPVAPHPDNGFGADRNGAEAEATSPYANAPSSAGMWQSSAGKSPAGANAAATESPLIEF